MVKQRLPNRVGKGWGGHVAPGRVQLPGKAVGGGAGWSLPARPDGAPWGLAGGPCPLARDAPLGAGSCWLTAGLSHRYAEVVVASENSVHKLLELLPGKILNGDKVEVRLATRQNLSQFEAQARKRE